MILILIFDGVTKTAKQSVFLREQRNKKVLSEAEIEERDTGFVRLARLARVRPFKLRYSDFEKKTY